MTDPTGHSIVLSRSRLTTTACTKTSPSLETIFETRSLGSELGSCAVITIEEDGTDVDGADVDGVGGADNGGGGSGGSGAIYEYTSAAEPETPFGAVTVPERVLPISMVSD